MIRVAYAGTPGRGVEYRSGIHVFYGMYEHSLVPLMFNGDVNDMGAQLNSPKTGFVLR